MALECLPKINKLEHGVAANGWAQDPLTAIIIAVNKLVPDVQAASASLTADAARLRCPEEECPDKTTSQVTFEPITFRLHFDNRQNQWECFIGVKGVIEITCKPRVEG